MIEQDSPDTPTTTTTAQHVTHDHEQSERVGQIMEEEQEESPETRIETNPNEIVRSIASYLSLSDVESIGSLSRYSIMSPHRDSHHNIRTPRRRKSSSATGSTVNGSYRFLQGGGGAAAASGDASSMGVLSRSSNRIFGSFGTLASIDDSYQDDAGDYIHNILPECHSRGTRSDENLNQNHSSGPDAGAGVGFDKNAGNDSNSSTYQQWGESSGMETPGLVALSPIPLDEEEEDEDSSSFLLTASPSSMYGYAYGSGYEETCKNDDNTRTTLHLKRIQEKLKNAVLFHPESIRSYCLSSHRTAIELKKERLKRSCTLCPQCHMIRTEGQDIYAIAGMKDQTYLDECTCDEYAEEEKPQAKHPPHERILQFLASSIFDNIPLSILLDISFQTLGTSVKVTQASISLTTISADFVIVHLAVVIHQALDILSENANPFTLLKNIFRFQRNAMGKTGEAIATGIQSVATGVGSAYPTSAGTRSPRSGMVSAGHSFVEGLLRSGGVVRDNVISDKLYRKLNKINPAAKVIAYIEGDDDALTQHAKKRVQRMMHYSVPLRPFMATIKVPAHGVSDDVPLAANAAAGLFGNVDFPTVTDVDDTFNQSRRRLVSERSSAYDTDEDYDESPFLCTPKSFPPTPSSRAHVLARGTKFAEDVVFLARDQLRVEEGLESENEQTRAMAKALREGKRLAVFNASDVGGGINLSCGQHCASKVGNDIYSTARGMIPVLRNSFVYFEMTVSTPPLLSMMLHHASLSIGLSTLEMPLNALVGAWKGSVGLCSTGQILKGSQWCSPLNPKTYGTNCTIGCLVYLDDDSAFETWDGLMVTANVVFNVDETVIIPGGPPGFTPSERTQKIGEEGEGDQRYVPALALFVPRDEELFPTLTLHSSQTEVLCRFCAEDILAASRSAIGAPRGVTVYCCDGSVLFDERNSSESCDSSFSEESDGESSVDVVGNDLEEENKENNQSQ